MTHGHTVSLEQQYSCELISVFESLTGFRDLTWEVKTRLNSHVLYIFISQPNERLYRLLEQASASVPQRSLFPVLPTFRKKAGRMGIGSPEAQLLVKTISECLSANIHVSSDDFMSRYIPSVFGAEDKICSRGNHVVLGRRGSGKSTLLLYSKIKDDAKRSPTFWVDFNTYARRGDALVVRDVLREIFQGAFERHLLSEHQASSILEPLGKLSGPDEGVYKEVLKILPVARSLFTNITQGAGDVSLYFDDFHLIQRPLQPRILGVFNNVCRHNRVSIRISAIETFFYNFNREENTGLEVPHDAQLIKLDYNLTMADKARAHILSILDSHAKFCGIQTARVLCTETEVLDRLVWIAAGVPRDALNVFIQAISKAKMNNRQRVTLNDLNVSSSDLLTDKLRNFDYDSKDVAKKAKDVLETIKTFCIKQEKQNAFLVDLTKDDDVLEIIRELVDLRMLHVIHEGISMKNAGDKFLGLILDYGFYMGQRAARSIELFHSKKTKKYRDFRLLPKFKLSA